MLEGWLLWPIMAKNVVLFLGAGFSKPFGLPVMDEFFEHAEASTQIEVSEKAFLREL